MTEHPYTIGANYLIRTVTMINTGRLVAVFSLELVVGLALALGVVVKA